MPIKTRFAELQADITGWRRHLHQTPELQFDVHNTAAVVAGSAKRDTPPIMPAEDFSYMLNARPGAYMFLGVGDGPMVHQPEYDFNDDIIPAGCSWFAELVERRMPSA